MRTNLLLAAALAGIGASGAAAQRTVDPVTTTEVSGFRSSEVTWLAVGEGLLGISGLGWSEDGDKPCWMQVYQRALQGEVTSSWTDPMDICGVRTSHPFSVDSGKSILFGDNPRYFVRGIRACNNNRDNHRLKGVRIYAAKVWATRAQIDELSHSEAEDRTNCATWDAPVYCPDGQIASAVVVHHSDDEITGLALRCRRVVW